MRCPVCGSKETLDEEYYLVDNLVERKWSCENCESVFYQRGTTDEDGFVESWNKEIVAIEPSEQGEILLTEKHLRELMKLAETKTIPMFEAH